MNTNNETHEFSFSVHSCIHIMSNPAVQKLAFFSRFFSFPNKKAALILGSLMVANGVGHGTFAYFYLTDRDATLEFLAALPSRISGDTVRIEDDDSVTTEPVRLTANK